MIFEPKSRKQHELQSAVCFNCDVSEVAISPFQTDAIRILYTPHEHSKYIKEQGLPKNHTVRAKLVLRCSAIDQKHILNIQGCRQWHHQNFSVRNIRPGTLGIQKIRDVSPSNTQVIQCQESSIQFGAVDQGTVAEAIFTIRTLWTSTLAYVVGLRTYTCQESRKSTYSILLQTNYCCCNGKL